MTTREDIVAYAKTLAGLSANPADALTRRVYLDMVAPGETPARAAEMALMSGCALTCRAILRRFIRYPILEAPYRTGRAMQDLVDLAQTPSYVALWSDVEDRIKPGDMLIVGGGEDGGGPEHAWTALSCVADPGYEPGVGYLLDGLDGGQRTEGGHQLIEVKAHELRDGWDVTATSRRRVRYVIDVMAIVGRFGR